MTWRPIRRLSARRVLLGVLATGVVFVGAVGLLYRDQIVRYATHLKAAPPRPSPGRRVRPATRPSCTWRWPVTSATAALASTPPLRPSRSWNSRQSVAALALLGDNAYPAGDPANLPETDFTPFGPLLDGGTELLAPVRRRLPRHPRLPLPLIPAECWPARGGGRRPPDAPAARSKGRMDRGLVPE